MSAEKQGRPKHAKNRDYETAEAVPSRCPQCGSTRRRTYDEGKRRELATNGIHDGQPYTAIVYRPTACLDCGQARIDREWLNEPAA